MSRACPWPDCEASIPGAMFLCPEHWKALPLRDRNDLTAAVTRERRARPTADGLADPDRHREAVKHLAAVRARVLRTATPALP